MIKIDPMYRSKREFLKAHKKGVAHKPYSYDEDVKIPENGFITIEGHHWKAKVELKDGLIVNVA